VELKGEFKDKVVLVTGAASGIGAALCRRFARAGAAVALLDQDGPGAAALAQELESAGAAALALAGDVSREADCTAAVETVIGRFGGIDVLVNNAGITQRSAFAVTQARVFERVMAVNFFGSLYCTRAAIASLTARRGSIVVMESIAGIAPLIGRSGYCASKHALHGLFTTLRAELRSAGVGVTIVCPGFVQTHLQTRALGGDGRVTAHPQSRVGGQMSAEQVAEAVIRAVAKRKPLLLLSPVGVLTYWLTRFAPMLYERLMARQIREEGTSA
jgi:NAD(P)-dependent dehydrogenase (short-subunit alcohol dehydrogenase family)